MRSIATSLCLTFAVVCAAEAQDPSAQVDTLIRELGADSSDTRDAAQQKLIELGKVAVPALRKATESEDLEVSSRAREALASIDKASGKQEPADRPARPQRPGMPQIPDMDEVLKELQKDLDQQMPDMGKMFEKLFEEFQNPGQDEQGNPNRPRTRVWTFNNNSGGSFSGISSTLGLGLGSPSAALRAQLGIEGRNGLVVNQVMAGGWAAEHGIQQHDVIVRRDGRPVKTMKDLNPVLGGGVLQLYRKAKLETIKIPGQAPESEGTTKPRQPENTPEGTPKKGRNF